MKIYIDFDGTLFNSKKHYNKYVITTKETELYKHNYI